MSFRDSDDLPVPSVIVEVWQANANGRYRHPQDRSDVPLDPQFDGFARLRSNDHGICVLTTIKPGAHRVSGHTRAPHLRLTLFASGIDRLTTQIFFEGEPLNSSDPLLDSVADFNLRERLIARRDSTGDVGEAAGYEVSIVFRGERETPFFDDTSEAASA